MIVVDLGNTRAKFGFFQNGYRSNAVPEPDSVLAVNSSGLVDSSGFADSCSFVNSSSSGFDTVIDWLNNLDKPETWFIAQTGNFSWNELQTKLIQLRPCDQFKEISYKDIPIPIDVEFPEKVGLDRLLSVYAASCWRTFNALHLGFEKETRILVVDAGSAVTVDLLAGEGYFAGGAILPGLNAMAESLAKISPQLPRIPTDDISFAVYPGKNTEEALAAGIYWGAVGAIRQFHQLVQTTLQDAGLPSRVPIFLVGGDAKHLQIGLSLFMESENLFLFPNFVLSGIALTFQNL
ncbi:MAG: type III pantothenate kinase [Planctomycetaceae bacterium]|jgi:type III pantothenate kinase|nr:type III pantothenate kinase [Planctomycetaceae bacterium]